MPLVLMVGIPASGKSTRAKQLAEFLCARGVEVQIVNEELLGLNKREYLADPTKEKIMRASLKSNVKKHLDQSRVVILDSMNYIKGYRYELFCLAREAMTTLALVWCDTHRETAKQWCEEAAKEEESKGEARDPFPPELFEDYASRLEFPNPAKRWDNPLFQLRADEDLPCEKIHEALMDVGKNKPRDPVSTKPQQKFDANFLFELDKKT